MEKHRFMSEGWIGVINKIREDLGDVEVPDNAKSISLNFTVTYEDGEEKASVSGGELRAGHAEDGKTTLILPAEVAQKLFVERDQSAAMQAFMSGQIKVEGDMSQLMQMQSMGSGGMPGFPAEGNPEEIGDKIKEMTTW
jgi:putative sterol carrier protein